MKVVLLQLAALHARLLRRLLLGLDGALSSLPHLPLPCGEDSQEPHPEQPRGGLPHSAPRSAHSFSFLTFKLARRKAFLQQKQSDPLIFVCVAEKCRSEEDLKSMDSRNKITQDMLQPKVERSFSDEEGSSDYLLEFSDNDSDSSDMRYNLSFGAFTTCSRHV